MDESRAVPRWAVKNRIRCPPAGIPYETADWQGFSEEVARPRLRGVAEGSVTKPDTILHNRRQEPFSFAKERGVFSLPERAPSHASIHSRPCGTRQQSVVFGITRTKLRHPWMGEVLPRL